MTSKVISRSYKMRFTVFLFCTFIYEHILIIISMNANIKMAHIFQQLKYDLKGHLKSYKMRFSYFLFCTFFYELILIIISMNANIKMAHIFANMKYDLKGHLRSYKMIFLLKMHLFFNLFFV